MQNNNKLMELIKQVSEVTDSESSETTAAGIAETESQQAEPENSVSLILDFIAESKVQLKSAKAGLLELQTRPGDREVLNQIFHSFHTIKGMAGFLNLAEIGSLAHSAENLLGPARKGELVLGGNNIQAVSASIDMLETMIINLILGGNNIQAVSASIDMLETMIVNLKKSIESGKALTHKVDSGDEKDDNIMFKAKAIMTTNVISVKKQTEIYEAIRILVENNITGLPVVNDDMSIAGIITEKDVLKLLYDVENTPGKVEDFMTKGVVGFNEEDSLVDITECLLKNTFRRVPITAGGKLVGIISRKDIIAYILKLRHKGKALAEKTV